ncbi:MAG TPA: PD-(D/E)XK nuclease family protein [Bacteroidota bacterium]|nr:PD-(D/E)XK nuclease family protein [Bacteroidota bacterium]
MSEVRVIAAGDNLIDEVASALVSEGHDFSRNIVVFPGKRPAHALRRAIAGSKRAGIIPPRIFSADSFIDYLAQEHLGLHLSPLEPLDAIALLHPIYLAEEHRPGGSHFEDLEEFLPLGQKLFAELEEVRIAQIPERRLREVLSGITAGNAASFQRLFEQFYAEAEKSQLATRSMRYGIVADSAENIDLAGFRRVVVAGFFALTEAERRIFSRIRGLENAVLIFQQGIGLGVELERLGIPVDLPAPSQKRPNVSFYQCTDTHGEVFALTNLLAGLKDGNPSEIDESVVVLPAAEALFPVYHGCLPLFGEQGYNISLGYPLLRTPVFGFVRALLELLSSRVGERFSVPRYVEFILHPYTKNIRLGGDPEKTRILFNTIEEHFLKGTSASLVALQELEEDDNLLARASDRIGGIGAELPPGDLKAHLRRVHDMTIRVFDGIGSVGEFANALIGVLRFVDEESTARLHPFFYPFAAALVESLERLCSSLLAPKRLASTEAYVSFFRTYLATVEVPFTGTPLHGLQVLGFLETRSLHFKNVYLLDANEDTLPGNRGNDVVLSTKVRESLGLPTYRDLERGAEYYFNGLLSGAANVHLFYVQEGRREKSRFVEKLLWERQQEARVADTAGLVQSVRYSFQLGNRPPAPIPKTQKVLETLRKLPLTPTRLDAYLRCELRFYYAHVLRLNEREILDEEIAQSDVGTLVHAILRSYFIPLRGKRMTKETLSREELDRRIDEEFSLRYGANPVGAAHLMKIQVRKHLQDFLALYQMPALDRPIELIDVEVKLEGELYGVRMTGMLDRVEARQGTTVILDYKTGSNDRFTKIDFDDLLPEVRESWNDHIGSLQLPLYAMLYSKARGIPIERVRPAYLFLGKQEIDGKIETPLFVDDETAAEQMALMDEIAGRLVSEIFDLNVPFRPPRRLEQECRNCPFKVLCGTQWVV